MLLHYSFEPLLLFVQTNAMCPRSNVYQTLRLYGPLRPLNVVNANCIGGARARTETLRWARAAKDAIYARQTDGRTSKPESRAISGGGLRSTENM